MNIINVLDKNTIDKIAAGEVVDRPSSVVKELVENAIDAGANSISVEIKDGGISLIRITDNGVGIDPSQIDKAFLRHSTSKISKADDLSFINTLGFRGEALSSICAVSKMEFCTKTKDNLTGVIAKVNGGEILSISEAGLPDGTTVIVRDLFFNTPARLKFLKSPAKEADYVQDVIECIILSHPEISFKFTVNGKVKILTSGNNNLKDSIYSVFGKDIAKSIIPINAECDYLSIDGFISKPEFSKANRNFEIYFINGRFIKDKIIASAIEQAYSGYLMKGAFPFVVLNLKFEPELIDVNVHPSKMEIRFFDNEKVFDIVSDFVLDTLKQNENIPMVCFDKVQKPKEVSYVSSFAPEPFEVNRTRQLHEDSIYFTDNFNDEVSFDEPNVEEVSFSQSSLFDDSFLSSKARIKHKIIGQVFDTYWIVEYNDELFIIDQHAAHEKVLYEQFAKKIKEGSHSSQLVNPPIIVSLSSSEENVLRKFMGEFNKLGFEINEFGGHEFAISEVPTDLCSLNEKDLFLSFINDVANNSHSFSSDLLTEKIASLACKAAVKGGMHLSLSEANNLIDELLSLDNPYNCPHGRPTIIRMSKSELERKFKRLV